MLKQIPSKWTHLRRRICVMIKGLEGVSVNAHERGTL